MKIALALAVVFLCSCGPETPAAQPAPAPTPAPAPSPAPTPIDPSAEPEHIKVQHILVGFAGAPRLKATRTKDEAKKLAETIFAEAKTGASMATLLAKYGSDDSGEGIYGLSNNGVAPKAGSQKRSGMVPAFGNVGFKLAVGGVGMAAWDSKASPYGWHIIKRIE